MPAPSVSKESLRAIAAALGLSISDESINDLLPQIQRAVDSMDALDSLGLEDVEPAVKFFPQIETE